jgi:GH25 family lysozyme M1 (1,4-beta-N-acetylmuramidase)
MRIVKRFLDFFKIFLEKEGILMSVKTYTETDKTQLSEHFNAQEFRCKCGGSHDILISSELVNKLEQLYSTLQCSKIIVSSGYRCAAHDKAVGGNGSGQHTKGTAADVICYDAVGNAISSKIVSCTAQDLGFGGIANITSAYTSTHLDVRSGSKWYGDETTGTNTATDDFYTYYGISRATQSVLYRGIDVSKHQGKIDWDKVKASGAVDFAIIRAGYGKETNQVDSQFERNYSECQRVGIHVGAYWYSYATTAEEAKQEAAVFLQAIKGKQFAYPVAYDIEESKSLTNASALCTAFCDAIEAAGYYAAIYTYKSALENNISDSIKSRYDIFLSHIGVDQTTYQGDYGMWQYSWTGKIDGITTDVDLDYAYKDYPAIIKKAGLNGFSTADAADVSTVDDTNTIDDATDNTSTLKQILQHIANIDKKL